MSELKRDLRPILLRFGVALALSYAGFLYSRIRSRRVKSLLPPPSSPKASGRDNGNRNIFSATSPRVTISSITQENDEMHRCRIIVGNSIAAPKSPSSSSTETPRSDVETPRSSITAMEKDTYEEEIKQLKNTVKALQDRERNLEARLIEYYGFKEQESAATELQNRLKLKNMESRLMSLKIESLKTENNRLEKQVSEHAKVISGLEIARSKIRVLKTKLRSEAEKNREQILQLQKRVEKLLDRDSGADVNPMKMKDLEHDVEELRESNARLRMENADLAQRLESTQILANSMLEDPETEALKRETEHLRRENESLAKEVDQLQVDRCSDVEELVYLRWINACLRYELRNYEPPSGRTAARDLSKTLSPKSEEIAKQLILEYAAFSEVALDKVDFDLLDEWSSSRFSCLTDSGKLHDSSFCNSNSYGKANGSSKKKKLFGKLRKLILGKDVHEENPNPNPNPNPNFKPELVRDVSSSDSSTGRSSTLGPFLGSARHSLDIQRLRRLRLENDKDSEHKRRNSDLGFVYHLNRESGLVQTDDHLAKYAKALRHS